MNLQLLNYLHYDQVNHPVATFLNSRMLPRCVVTREWADSQTRRQHHLHGNATRICRDPELHKCIVMLVRLRNAFLSRV